MSKKQIGSMALVIFAFVSIYSGGSMMLYANQDPTVVGKKSCKDLERELGRMERTRFNMQEKARNMLENGAEPMDPEVVRCMKTIAELDQNMESVIKNLRDQKCPGW